jgi:putative peptidoglycan lipid II flippase
MIASGLEKGSTSALYYASRIEELTLGLFSIALAAALLPAFSEQVAARDIGEMKKTLGFSLKLTAIVTFPAAAGLVALNGPIIRTLFERGMFDRGSTALSASCLLFFALGLPFVSGVKVVAPAFFSLKDTRTPVAIGIAVMLVNTAVSLLLMGPLRVGGLALSLSLSQVLNFVLLFLWLERKVGPLGRGQWVLPAAKSAAAAAVMGTALRLLWPAAALERAAFVVRAGALAAAIVTGVVIYVALLRVLSPADLKSVVGTLKRAAGKERS